MNVVYDQLVQSLRKTISERLRCQFLLGLQGSPVAGVLVLQSHKIWSTDALYDNVRLAIESQGYRVADVESGEHYFDGLAVKNNGDKFARFAVTNNTKYGRAIILSVDPAGSAS